ncbi:MAG: N-acetylmuramoyl-L-alanine amidase [Leptolyngbyaceae cyanobacterium RU_5_1]|nr:N-acetylmuramoyl-L-alanine amidase [Leptolyngbyaceae cyanobacterium RU_5_1]
MKGFVPNYLLLVSSLLLLAAPAEASKLESWKFDASQNQLEFTTDQGVQPKAQLVADPTRLVIDLPGVVLGRPMVSESVGGRIQAIRIGQLDRETTRLVIELVPGYTLDPNRIKFRGVTARQWLIQLPAPQPIAGVAPQLPTSNPSAVVVSTALGSSSVTAPAPPTPSSVGRFQHSAQTNLAAAQLATIEAVELDNSGTQLVIRANQPVSYTSRWDRSLSAYRIEITPAQLAKQVKGPQLDANSPILQLRVRQENSQTVAILVQPASRVQVGQVSQLSQRILALQLQRPQPTQTSPVRAIAAIPAAPSSPSNPLPAQIPRMPDGRPVVIIDPGHGGPDPGAIGISGLQEKGIVLDIGTRVAVLLQQQGIQAFLTRNDDRDLGLEPRVQMAEQVNAAVFVSIHANAISLSRPDVNGLETYYYQSGEELARMIHQSILQTTGVQDRRVRTARFYVLRRTSMPSVLVEVGFVTGQDDAARLSNPSYRNQMAEAIARGILQYLYRTAQQR